MKSKNHLSSVLMLLLTALIWGTAFVAQSVGMEYIGPFTFGGIRFIIGGIVLLPFIFIRQRLTPPTSTNIPQKSPSILRGGLCCGAVLAIASSFQQIGIMYTTVGKAGFITALYIVLVPIFGIFLGKKPAKKIWISVITALIGLYLLCMTDSFSNFNPGDFLLFIGSFCFALHILVIDYFSPQMDGVKLSCAQFFFAGAFSLIAMFVTEQPNLANILDCWGPILYAGVLSCGIAYTLQVIAQKNINPTIASLLMSMESVFSVLAGWMILNQTLSVREILGCMLMFFAIIWANLQDNPNSQAIPTSKKHPKVQV